MKIDPIEIDSSITGGKLLTDLCHLLDNDEYKTLVYNVRIDIGKLLNLSSSLPIPVSQYLNLKNGTGWDIVLNEVTKLRKKFSLTQNYENVILKSIFCGKVNSKDYYLAKLRKTINSYDTNDDVPDDKYSIDIYPGVRDSDLKAINKEFKLALSKGSQDVSFSDENVASYEWSPKQPVTNPEDKPTISQARNWYNLVKVTKQKTTIQVANELLTGCPVQIPHSRKDSKNCTCFDESTVRKSITAYECFLRKDK